MVPRYLPPWHSPVLPAMTPGFHRCLARIGFESDGSTWSPDTIWGVRIGESTREYRPDLPAWMHDARAFCARRAADLRMEIMRARGAQELHEHYFPAWWTAGAFEAANQEFLNGLLYCVGALPWGVRSMARLRCRTYFFAVTGTDGWGWWKGELAETPRQRRARERRA